MKNLTFFLLFIALAWGCQPAETPKKAVFIILDGIPPDVLERVSTPALDEIAGASGYSRAWVGGERGGYNETPTISAPGYMSLITASWANKHNMWGNYEQSPNYNYWNIFRIVETADSSLHTAIFSTWLDNRTILVGEGQPGAGDFRIDYAYDGFELDTVQFPHDEDRQFILHIDEKVADEAGRYIAEKGPDLSWVYLEYTDDIGHIFGDSEQMDDAVQKADRQVRRIWEAVKKRQAMGEDWMIVVTTDHGRDSLTGKDHGGQSDRERLTWMVTNVQKGLNHRFTQGDPPITDIAPSILRFMGVEAPEAVRAEMDGTPFLGELSFDNLQASLEGDRLRMSWTPHVIQGKARLMVAFSNQYKEGGKDGYVQMAEAPVGAGEYEHILSREQQARFAESKFLKVWLSAPLNDGNRWVMAQ